MLALRRSGLASSSLAKVASTPASYRLTDEARHANKQAAFI
jgi:hypothetical protein